MLNFWSYNMASVWKDMCDSLVVQLLLFNSYCLNKTVLTIALRRLYW
jgi:hypothetical protein